MPKEDKSISTKLPIHWEDVEECPLIFVNQMAIQNSTHEFFLLFAQIQPPLTIDGEEISGRPKEVVVAKTQVRLAIPASRFGEFLALMNENYEKYIARLQAMQKEMSGNE